MEATTTTERLAAERAAEDAVWQKACDEQDAEFERLGLTRVQRYRHHAEPYSALCQEIERLEVIEHACDGDSHLGIQHDNLMSISIRVRKGEPNGGLSADALASALESVARRLRGIRAAMSGGAQ